MCAVRYSSATISSCLAGTVVEYSSSALVGFPLVSCLPHGWLEKWKKEGGRSLSAHFVAMAVGSLPRFLDGCRLPEGTLAAANSRHSKQASIPFSNVAEDKVPDLACCFSTLIFPPFLPFSRLVMMRYTVALRSRTTHSRHCNGERGESFTQDGNFDPYLSLSLYLSLRDKFCESASYNN